MKKITQILFSSIFVFSLACTEDTSPETNREISQNTTATASSGSTTSAGSNTSGGNTGSSTGNSSSSDLQPDYEVVKCGNALEASGNSLTPGCIAKSGQGKDVFLSALYVIGENTIYENGSLIVDDSGKVACVGCDCAATKEKSFNDAATIECPGAVISPGFINTHEHLNYTEEMSSSPLTDERYEHRHDWRKGKRGHSKIPAASNASTDGIYVGEIRHLMSGVTSIMGSTGKKGLLRNLDVSGAAGEGIENVTIKSDTFPLGDSGGFFGNNCADYKPKKTAQQVAAYNAYIPHVAEGIDEYANLEFKCMIENNVNTGSIDLLPKNKSFIIHGVGLEIPDIAQMASKGIGLSWSPRSNISLYGYTAPAPVFHKMGVKIALGTDWLATGSMNMFRELSCVYTLNGSYYDNYFKDQTIFEMVTKNGALAARLEDKIGSLSNGKLADIAAFRYDSKKGGIFASALKAGNTDVHFVMRSGKLLYGDAEIVTAIKKDQDSGCEALNVCGSLKAICAEEETGKKIADLNKDTNYPLFYCDTPDSEPTCLPSRPSEFTGVKSGDDRDGDGILDVSDSCPQEFNPKLPLYNNSQGDFDQDGTGDICDPCPQDKGTAECTSFDPQDPDSDGVPTTKCTNGNCTSDNCPNTSNNDQKDSDQDGIGDACDECPNDASNKGGGACPAQLADIKGDKVAIGKSVTVDNLIITAAKLKYSCYLKYDETNPDPNYCSNIKSVDKNDCHIGYFAESTEKHSGDPASDAKNRGIFIFVTKQERSSLPELSVGDIVSITGKKGNYYDQIQLSSITKIDLKSSNNKLPNAPVIVRANEIASKNSPYAKTLEGMRVRVEENSISVTKNASDQNNLLSPGPGDGKYCSTNEFEINNAVRVNDLFFEYSLPDVGNTFKAVEGILRYANGNYKVEVLDANGLEKEPGVPNPNPGTNP